VIGAGVLTGDIGRVLAEARGEAAPVDMSPLIFRVANGPFGWKIE
jgi:hypothetical protein